MATYYIETKTSLREATPEEASLISFLKETGFSTYCDGFVFIIYDENMEELSEWVENSCVNPLFTITHYWCEEGKERLYPCDAYLEYNKLTAEGRQMFMDYIHGLWQPVRNRQLTRYTWLKEVFSICKDF